MARTAAFKITRADYAGNNQWKVEVPASMTGSGRRIRKFFRTRGEAEGFAGQVKTHEANYGASANILPAAEAELARRAFDMLEPWGRDALLRAVREFIARRDVSDKSPTMSELFALWRTEKPRKPKFLDRLAQLERRCAGMIDIKVADLTAEDIELHALRDAAPMHRNQILRELRAMIKHSENKGWRTEPSPIAQIGFKHARKGLTHAYSADETKDLLRATVKHCEPFIPSLALCLFAGIRPEGETLSIEWGDIDLAEGFIDIRADTAKRDRDRHIIIEPVLRAWLEWFIERNGPQTGRVCPWTGYRSIMRNRNRVLEAAGLTHSPDVYRHTFASAHLSNFGDLTRLVTEMGHEGGPELLHKHYLRKMRKAEAARFWQLTPEVVIL